MFQHHRPLLAPLWAALCVAAALHSPAALFHEEFASDPATRGWKSFGNTALFHWNAANQNLEITWDSSQANSYFHRPLGTVLSKEDDFSLAFDLQLADVKIGTTSGNPYSFQLAVGFVNWTDATRPDFLRGTGINSPNVAEFDYFPDSGFGATISPTIISSNNQFATSFNFPFELTTNDWFHIELTYTAANHTLATLMTRNGVPFGPIADATQAATFSDFRLDQVAICSYSDAGQDPLYGGSILAHGVVDNIVLNVPPPPIANLVAEVVDGRGQVRFDGRTNWLYSLERTLDFTTWIPASGTTGGGSGQTLLDTNEPASRAFYRVRAERP
jgi:hypothetical protein